METILGPARDLNQYRIFNRLKSGRLEKSYCGQAAFATSASSRYDLVENLDKEWRGVSEFDTACSSVFLPCWRGQSAPGRGIRCGIGRSKSVSKW